MQEQRCLKRLFDHAHKDYRWAHSRNALLNEGD